MISYLFLLLTVITSLSMRAADSVDGDESPMYFEGSQPILLEDQLKNYKKLCVRGVREQVKEDFAQKVVPFLTSTESVVSFHLILPAASTTRSYAPEPRHVKAIFAGLKDNASVKDLLISSQVAVVGQGDMAAFSELLEKNATLESINVSFNDELGDLTAFTKALASNTALKNIAFKFYKISLTEAQLITASLTQNKNLVTIDLELKRPVDNQKKIKELFAKTNLTVALD